MSLLHHLAATSLDVVVVAAPVACVVLASRALLDRLDDRRLLKAQPLLWLPLAAAAALEWALLRASGLAPALDPYGLWTAQAWAVDLGALHARHLAPGPLAAAAATTVAALPGQPLPAALLAVTTAVAAGLSWLAWRSPAAWRGVVLHLWLTAAGWALLHHTVVLVCWTLHWLNFWVFFVLLAFAQMRRKEGSGPKVNPS